MKPAKLILFFLISFVSLSAQTRYLDEIFPLVTTTHDIEYGQNITIYTVPTTGEPSEQSLVLDFYEPSGDTETERPLMVIFHGGNFLPPGFSLEIPGTREDYSVTQLATRLAKRGYVAAVASYRQGWTPIGDFDTKAGTLTNAIYRGTQDARTCARFFRKSVYEEGNPYGICPDKMGVIGIGTGGFIALSTATIDSYEDLLIPKFLGYDPSLENPEYPYVDPAITGDPNGETEAILNIPNHVGYSSDYQLCVNIGGAIPEISWLDETDPPVIGFQTPGDPRLPYDDDALRIFISGDIIFSVQGSLSILTRANDLGLNQVFADVPQNDDYTLAAIASAENPNNTDIAPVEGGLSGLMPFNRPFWINPFNNDVSPEYEPWEAWDAAFWSEIPHPQCPSGTTLEECNTHLIYGAHNQDMSDLKAFTYIDSIFGYFSPRAAMALGLNSEASCLSGLDESSILPEMQFEIMPNPAEEKILVRAAENEIIEEVELISLSGLRVDKLQNINASNAYISCETLREGLYLLRIKVGENYFTEKVVIK